MASLDVPDPLKKIFTVTEITYLIRRNLEESFPALTIEGEISNFRPSSTGHFYFTLKDREAVISAVMFRNRISHLSFSPGDGMVVKAFGSISVYPRRGSYQLICETLIRAGEGELLAMLEERKKTLAAEGLFLPARKKPLPILPERVAVVTSPTGAAIRDILHVLKRRNAGVNLVLLPAPVQGEEAAAVIARQIRVANTHSLGDVIIVGRGGGSLEDLLPFFDEEVVREIAHSHIPVISAVGHEIDYTLTDLAADVRAPTPSAAAEMVAAPRDELTIRIQTIYGQMIEILGRRIEKARLLLSAFSKENLERNFRLILQSRLQRFDELREGLSAEMSRRLSTSRHRLELLAEGLSAHSPMDILKRGFSVVSDSSTGKIIRSSQETNVGSEVDIRLHMGHLLANVKEKSDEVLRRQAEPPGRAERKDKGGGASS